MHFFYYRDRNVTDERDAPVKKYGARNYELVNYDTALTSRSKCRICAHMYSNCQYAFVHLMICERKCIEFKY